ncbi:TPA: hypothetical protein ACH3X1_014429 [Trebouxia sp. C0004]
MHVLLFLHAAAHVARFRGLEARELGGSKSVASGSLGPKSAAVAASLPDDWDKLMLTGTNYPLTMIGTSLYHLLAAWWPAITSCMTRAPILYKGNGFKQINQVDLLSNGQYGVRSTQSCAFAPHTVYTFPFIYAFVECSSTKQDISTPEQVGFMLTRDSTKADKLEDQVKQLMVDYAALNAKSETASVYALWQRISMLPPDTAVLFGQEAQLNQLQKLTEADGITVLTIWGMAGMGKTTLATAFARQLWEQQQVDCACYADLRGQSTADTALLKIQRAFQQLNNHEASRLQSATEAEDAEAITQQIFDMLQQCSGHFKLCLVVDNAEDVMDSHGQDEFEKSIAQMLTAAPSLLMIVTSRNRALFASHNLIGRSMEIQQLASEDAEKMIWQCAASDTPEAVVAELAASCGNVPIALLVVSSYIADSASAAKNMVEVLQALGLAKGIESISTDRRLRLCISFSLERMPSNDRLALAILSMFPNRFDVNAATAVLGVSRLATIQCLERLRLKCWVRDTSNEHYQLHLLI